MKFGRLLRDTAQELPELETLFLAYKRLKKQLKKLPDKTQLCDGDSSAAARALTEEENRFVEVLTSSVSQMNDMFIEREENAIIQIYQLETQMPAASSSQDCEQLCRQLVNLHGEMLLLVHWSILAYSGTVKILKKHYKRTGLLVKAPYLNNLLAQPFCSTEMMTGLIYKVESDIRSLNERALQLCSSSASPITRVEPVAPAVLALQGLVARTPDSTASNDSAGIADMDEDSIEDEDSLDDESTTSVSFGASCSELTSTPFPEAPPQMRTAKLMRCMEVALHTWELLRTTASSPSTILPPPLATVPEARLA